MQRNGFFSKAFVDRQSEFTVPKCLKIRKLYAVQCSELRISLGLIWTSPGTFDPTCGLGSFVLDDCFVEEHCTNESLTTAGRNSAKFETETLTEYVVMVVAAVTLLVLYCIALHHVALYCVVL
jgi:hypothetical protein